MANTALCWIRRDIRLADHTALAEACARANAVAVVFVFDTTILDRLQDRDDRRITFIHASLVELDAALRSHGSMLVVRHGDPRTEIPAVARALGAGAVYTNHDYEPAAKQRDADVAERLRAEGIAFQTFKDQVVFERAEVVSGSGEPYRVFTPYKRAWLARLQQEQAAGINPLAERRPDLARLAPAATLTAHTTGWGLQRIGFTENAPWLQPGERAAHERLAAFGPKRPAYRDLRDYPASANTSGLSVHLRFGTISVREVMRQAYAEHGPGAETWISELIWREFYQMILDQFPHVVERAFKPEYDNITWQGTEETFRAWCAGTTGYPIVDAAMRCFNATGWMHNRLRMIVASFLVKDLLVNYRWGEAYFARYLLDFDLAANNGGWQWCASTGCDAQPYFRIFNPVLQSARFDPDGIFIREHCPELRGFSNKRIGWPADADLFEQAAAGCVIGQDYPAPIVDHATQRDRALLMFKSAIR